MPGHRSTGIAFVMLFIAACSPSNNDRVASSDTPSPSIVEPTSVPAIASLPDDCRSFDDVPRRGEVTFVTGRRLFATTPDGSTVRCIGRSKHGVLPSWGGDADRFFLQVRGGAQVAFSDNRYEFSPFGAHPFALGLSRPTGTSVLFINNASTGLWKMDATGGSKQDISFLKRHDEAVYHPAGEHIAVTGVDDRGRYGIFLATNEGKEPHLLVLGEEAKRVFSLTFSPTGYLYYVAEHDDHYDVHGVSVEGSPSGEIVSTGLATFYSSKLPIANVVASQFRDRRLAIQVRTGHGGCAETVVVKTMGNLGKNNETTLTTGLLEDRATTPVAWLPSGDLVLEGLNEACRPAGDAYVWDGSETLLLATDATAISVRGLMPDPPDPPTKVPEVVA